LNALVRLEATDTTISAAYVGENKVHPATTNRTTKPHLIGSNTGLFKVRDFSFFNMDGISIGLDDIDKIR
jgi:hypothetical protein